MICSRRFPRNASDDKIANETNTGIKLRLCFHLYFQYIGIACRVLVCYLGQRLWNRTVPQKGLPLL